MEQNKSIEIKDIIYSFDLLNLTSDEIDGIFKDLDIEPGVDIDKIDHLYQIKNILFGNDEVRNKVENKIFAGRTSVKWYKFKADSPEEKDRIKKNLESDLNYFNQVHQIDVSQLSSPTKYTCIKNGENRYIIRILLPTGSKTYNNGMSVNKVKTNTNIVVIVDLSELYIEIRASHRDAKRIIDYISGSLSIENIIEVDLFRRYNGSIEEFKDSLCNGKFTETLCVPDSDIVLTKEKSELLANVLQALDEYFIYKELEKFELCLANIDIDTEGAPFTELLLSGMSKLGMVMRDDVEGDLSGQSLYKTFKMFVTNHKGYIDFSIVDDGPIYKIQAGITTKSISFMSSATEAVIEYIRNKIL